MTVIENIFDENDYNITVGKAFRKLREEENQSQLNWASDVGIDPKTVSRIENGKNALTINVIRKLFDSDAISYQIDLLDLCRILIVEPHDDIKK